MAKKNSNSKKQQCYISVPSQIINSLSSSSLQSLLDTPKKSSKTYSRFLTLSTYTSSKKKKLWLLAIFLFGFLGMLKLTFNLHPLISYVSYPCFTSQSQSQSESQGLVSNGVLKSGVIDRENAIRDEIVNDSFQSLRPISNGGLKSTVEFWKQPDGLGYKPCLDFSEEYRKSTSGIVGERTKYLMVVVSGGMNQQRNQIVDAVVIARILGAALVVPILQVNVIWGDESEFSDIFDLEHFKNVLADDVHVVSSLPSTHLMTRPVEEKSTPHHVSPSWIRSRYHRKVRMDQRNFGVYSSSWNCLSLKLSATKVAGFFIDRKGIC